MDNKKNIIIYIGLFLVAVVVGIIGFNIYDNIVGKNDGNDVVDNDDLEADDELQNNDVVEDNNSVKEDDNVATEIFNKDISYSGDYIDLGKYVEEFNSNLDYKGKLLNLTLDNIMINGKEYVFKFNKHPQSCTENILYYEKGHNEFYINDKLIYSQNNQACYLEMVHLITIIDNKYIGVSYRSQGGNYMKVYNSDIELVDTIEFIGVDIENGEIVYSEYEEGNGCLVNRYSYEILNDKSVKTFKEQVSNTTCNQMTGDGCCNY